MQSLKCNMSYSQNPCQLNSFINFITFVATVVSNTYPRPWSLKNNKKKKSHLSLIL